MQLLIGITVLSAFSANAILLQADNRQPWTWWMQGGHNSIYKRSVKPMNEKQYSNTSSPSAWVSRFLRPATFGDQNKNKQPSASFPTKNGALTPECEIYDAINAETAQYTAKQACQDGSYGEPDNGPVTPLMDPHLHILNFLTNYEKQPHGELIALSRPVSDKARSFMCRGLAVGKGFDIKPKSSKLEQPVNGFVSMCQACKWGDSPLADPTDDFNVLEMDNFCQTFNAEVDFNGKNVCFATHRAVDANGLRTLQHYAHHIVEDLGVGSPRTVDGRKCLLLEIAHPSSSGPTRFPFFAYKQLGGDKSFPIVSDYDLLFVGECPVPGAATPEEKYPLMNADTDYFKATDAFPRIVELVLGSYCTGIAKKNGLDMTKAQIGTELSDLVGGLTQVLDNKNIGLASKNMNLLLVALIDESAPMTGAFRHGAENENYMAPQPFEDRVYPFFTKEGAQPLFEEGNTGPQYQGEDQVIDLYNTQLEKGCCVPMNFHWLTGHESGFNTAKWMGVWEFAKQQQLDGCPYYRNQQIVNAVESFKTLTTLGTCVPPI